MPLQIIDYTKAPLLDSPAKNIFENILSGYKMSKEPAKMREEQSARELANKLKGLEVEHKPIEYELSDKQKSLANALQSKALEHYEEKFGLDRDLKKAQIQKALRTTTGSRANFNGIVANFVASHPNATQEDIQEFADRALEAQIRHTEQGTERIGVLNETQYNRGLSSISKKYDELKSIQNGKFPGTDRDLSPQDANNMHSSLMLGLVKETTDPKTREKLINANNMNITLDSIDSSALSSYSGASGQIDKMGDSILESAGLGSPQYKKYIENVNKANFAAKQMRQYLGDSIQPSAQAKLDKLTKPEAWNVSPETAKKNFDYMRELYKQESQTLVRAVSDPTLYQGIGVSNNPAKNQMFTSPAPKIPSTVRNKEEFQAWMKTLTPAERDALKAKHVGGR